MSYYYSAYGIIIKSDHPVSEFYTISAPVDSSQVDLVLHMDNVRPPFLNETALQWGTHSGFTTQVNAVYSDYITIKRSAEGHYILLRFEKEEIEFITDQNVHHVWAFWSEKATMEYVSAYVVSSLIGFLLRLKGEVCLHASAVEIDGEAILISGRSGHGKSTIASYFAAQGHSAITDDISRLTVKDHKIYVHPGYPRLRLLPDAASAVLGTMGGLPAIAEGWQKYYLPLNSDGFNFTSRPLLVKAVYVLLGRAEHPIVNPASPFDAVRALMENVFPVYLFDNALRTIDFQFITQFVASTPVGFVVSCSNLECLPVLYAKIMDHLETNT